ncbi:MAG: hypothetical protein WEC75_07030 [Dehalococcoidia bacterium]
MAAAAGAVLLAVATPCVMRVSAEPTAPPRAIKCQNLAAAIDGNTGDATTGGDTAAACDGLSQGELNTLEGTLGDGDGVWEYGDVDLADFDGNLLQDGAAPLPDGFYLFMFFDDDDPVTVDFPAAFAPDISNCAAAPPGGFGGDEDCDDDGVPGDRLLVIAFGDATGVGGAFVPGNAVQIGVGQEGLEYTIEIRIVGGPGTPAQIAIATEPEEVLCDGQHPSTVEASVMDLNGDNVTDGTAVEFTTDGLASAAPQLTTTSGGVATSVITPFLTAAPSGGAQVTVTAGIAQGFTEVVCTNGDQDGDGVFDSADNCVVVANPGQENFDSLGIGNGPGIPGDDTTVPNGDGWGDACDADDDNDDIFDATAPSPPGGSNDPDPRGDLTYDDDGDGNPAVGCYGGTDAGDDGPSWDTDCDGKRDGVPADCGSAVLDDDGDGLMNAWETCHWGTSNASADSDGDGLGDCVEAMDVSGNGVANVHDGIFILRAFFGVPGNGFDAAFDINGNGVITDADAIFVLRAFFGVSACL